MATETRSPHEAPLLQPPAPTQRDPEPAYVSGRNFRMLIGGGFAASCDGDLIEVMNPSTGKRLTAFCGVSPDMAIAREEIFGPVISVLSWGGYEEMLALANGVDLGLTASVWTNDLTLAHATAARLQAGYVWINDSSTHYIGAPFGGTKNSGLGREESTEELLSYLETRVIHAQMRSVKDALRALGVEAD